MGSRTARYTIAEKEQGIEAVRQFVIQCRRRSAQHTYIFAFFPKVELMDAVPNNGRMDLHVVGCLMTGQYFYGSDVASIKCWRRQPPPRRRRW